MTQIPLTICDPSQEQFDPKRHRDEVIEVRRGEPLPLLGRRPEASPPTAENVCDPSTTVPDPQRHRWVRLGDELIPIGACIGEPASTRQKQRRTIRIPQF